MLEPLKRAALRIFRVPPEPAVPAGRVVRVFRAAPNYFRYRLTLWILQEIGVVVGLVSGLLVLRAVTADVAGWERVALLGVQWAAVIGVGVQVLLSAAVLRLDFEMRWYVLMDRSLRIREGILSVREKTMTFANIQQISIRRNPLQRLLGLADVQVRTAGGGGAAGGGGSPYGGGKVGEGMHEAFFRGVDNAEEIRTAIRERVRIHRDAGLGDPDEQVDAAAAAGGPTSAGPLADVLSAARELRDEVRQWSRSPA